MGYYNQWENFPPEFNDEDKATNGHYSIQQWENFNRQLLASKNPIIVKYKGKYHKQGDTFLCIHTT